MRPRAVTIACVLAAVFAQAVRAADNTHFDNHSQKWTILATTSYPGGTSKFIKRSIPPGGSDVDTYSYVDHVDVTVQVNGAPFSNWFRIASDQSVIAEDTPGNQYGVDFWINDGTGKSVKTYLGAPIPPLVTIFGPGPPPTPSPTPTPTPTPTPPSTLAPLGDDDSCDDPENGYRSPSSDVSTAVRAPDHRIPAWEGTSTATFPAIGLLFKSKLLISSCAYGSAFAVGTNHIVTAAHMLYDPSKQVYTTPKYIDFGKVGKGNRGVAGGFNVKVKKCVVLDTWKNPNLSDADRAGYDIGACLVDTLPATVGFMDMVVPTYGSSTISTAGYPLEAPWPPGYTADTAIQKPFMTTETASITESSISFNSQGSRGQSGSPFFAAQGAAGAPARPASPSRPQAFGVLTQRPDSQTRTLGLPLTQQRINTIRGWMGNELSPS